MSDWRSIESELLRATKSLTQRRTATEIGISESRFSTLLKDGELEFTARLIAACGFRLTPASEPVFPPGHVQALETLARLYLDQPRERQL